MILKLVKDDENPKSSFKVLWNINLVCFEWHVTLKVAHGVGGYDRQ